MASLREHAQARKHQTTLSPVDAETFRQALRRTYERIRGETWGTDVPVEKEYVAVVLDRVTQYGRLTDDELKQFSLLSWDMRSQLALAVGPGEEEEEGGDDED